MMTTITEKPDRLAPWREYYQQIMQLDVPDYERDIRLAELMTLMENHFRIPLWRDEEYYRQNPDVIEFYRSVSFSRKTIWMD
ncbi:hypothetical protein [Effusibacillus pohliae]|uniref:hypothetical protein n=1 Tax=Effusibacillus pohliae TaxID=232270 RepID=UPI00037FCD08|nr:hypothetical protein [Effusibacillus pohliae]